MVASGIDPCQTADAHANIGPSLALKAGSAMLPASINLSVRFVPAAAEKRALANCMRSLCRWVRDTPSTQHPQVAACVIPADAMLTDDGPACASTLNLDALTTHLSAL